MENIQEVIRGSAFQEDNYYRKHWYFGKCLTEVMLSTDAMNAEPINDNCGLMTY